MQILDTFFAIVVLVMSVVIHEVAHGFMAYRLGDKTAFYANRLTLNPIKHLDPFGSVMLPILLALSNTGFVFGWAKPVPYNPNNIQSGKKGELKVALAGIVANTFIAILFSLFIRASLYFGLMNEVLLGALSTIVVINLLLAVFNLMPIPPLDGSKVIFSLLPYRYENLRYSIEKYSFVLIIIFVFFIWQYVSPIVIHLFSFLTGINF